MSFQCRLVNGRHVVKQLVNKFLRMHRRDKCDSYLQAENFDNYMRSVLKNGQNRLFFPAMFVRSYDLVKQVVVCEGLKITSM